MSSNQWDLVLARLPLDNIELRNVFEIACVDGDYGQPFDKRGRRYHPVDDFAFGKSGGFQNPAISLGHLKIEVENRQHINQRLYARPPPVGKFGFGIYAALKLNAGNGGKKRAFVQFEQILLDRLIVITQMDCDAGVEQISQNSIQSRTVRKNIGIALFDLTNRADFIEHCDELPQLGLLLDRINHAPKQKVPSLTDYLDFGIRRNAQPFWQAHGDAVAGFERFGVNRLIHAHVYTGYTGAMQLICASAVDDWAYYDNTRAEPVLLDWGGVNPP